MLMLERFWLRIRDLFRKKRFENEMDQELRFHVESSITDNIHAGMAPEEARRAALLAFGGVDRIKEDCRDTRWTRLLDELALDSRHALRRLARNPSFAAIGTILIAATIGLMCASYAVMDALVVRTLPVPHPEQLVVINQKHLLTASIYEVLERERLNISQIFGMKGLLIYGSAGNSSRALSIYGVRGDYFSAMGARPQLGRFLAANETNAVAVISDRLWRVEFDRTQNIIGRSVIVGGLAITIVGVALPDFIALEEPYSDWDAIIPSDTFGRIQGMGQIPLQIVARLKPGKTAGEYEAQLNSMWPAILQTTIPPKRTQDQWRDMIGAQAKVESASRGINYVLLLQPNIQFATKITFGLSVLIFVSGCLALILLAIARSIRNQHQSSIMMALGGERWRVLRPFFMEVLILSALGGAVGLMIAWWWSGLGTTFLPDSQYLNWRVRIDGRVVTLALSLTLCIVAILGSTTMLIGSGRASGRIWQSGGPVSRPSLRLRLGLLALQVAMSVLLIHYALFFNVTFSNLVRIPLGFDPENLHIYTVLNRWPERSISADYFPQLMAQIRQLPEVESAALTKSPPPMSFPLEYKQPVKADDGLETQATIVNVSAGYFPTLHLPLLSGRDFSWNDQNAAVVNETLLKKLYPDREVLGHTIAFGKPGTPMRIIGVAGNMAHFGPRWGNSTIAYVPYTASSGGGVTIMVRSKRRLQELGRAIQAQLDPPGIHYIARSVDQQDLLANSVQQERMLATVAGAFGGLIVLLAGVELYAFCNYLLAMRNKELAIRTSVGAGPAQIAVTLTKEILKALVVGLMIGAVMTVVGNRVLAGVAANLNPPDLRYLAIAPVIVAGITVSAVIMPAVQAIRINVAQALRVD